MLKALQCYEKHMRENYYTPKFVMNLHLNK